MAALLPIFLKEFEQQCETTHKFLKLVPEDKFDFKPHPKSMTMLQLSSHLAELGGWISMTLNTDFLDFADNKYERWEIKDNKHLLEYFEMNREGALKDLKAAKEEDLDKNWELRNQGQVLSTGSKADVIRMCLNQIVHHRAQLGVFLRILEIPIPGSFGPSADDPNFSKML